MLEIDLEVHFLDGSAVFLLPIIKRRHVLQECAAYIAVGVLVLLGLTYGENVDDWNKKTWSVWLVYGLCALEVLLTSLVSLIFYFHDFKKLAELSNLESGSSGFKYLMQLHGTLMQILKFMRYGNYCLSNNIEAPFGFSRLGCCDLASS